MRCCHCNQPITKEFPDNYYVGMEPECGWQIHARCWPEFVRICVKDGHPDFEQFLTKTKKAGA